MQDISQVSCFFFFFLHCAGVEPDTLIKRLTLGSIYNFHIYKYCALVSNSSPEIDVTISSVRALALDPTTRFMMASSRFKKKKKIHCSAPQQLLSPFSFLSIKKKRTRQKKGEREIIKTDDDQGENDPDRNLWPDTSWIPQLRRKSTLKHFKKRAQGDEGKLQKWSWRIKAGFLFPWWLWIGSLASSACFRTWGEWCRQRCHRRSLICRLISSSLDPSAPLVLSLPGLALPLCTLNNHIDNWLRCSHVVTSNNNHAQ